MGGKCLFSWSGGKDSALALYEILGSRDREIAALVTTVTEGYDRISMHGVRCALLEKQAESLGLPLEKVAIPPGASNEEGGFRYIRRYISQGSQGIQREAD